MSTTRLSLLPNPHPKNALTMKFELICNFPPSLKWESCIETFECEFVPGPAHHLKIEYRDGYNPSDEAKKGKSIKIRNDEYLSQVCRHIKVNI